MGYLVIKNGSVTKKYEGFTDTCNKPRIRLSNSYIPLITNGKTGNRLKVNGKEVAEWKSYTYTGNKRTITTGTTYLTRSSTSKTVYQTKTTTANTTIYTTYYDWNYGGWTLSSVRYNEWNVSVRGNFQTSGTSTKGYQGTATYSRQTTFRPSILTGYKDDGFGVTIEIEARGSKNITVSNSSWYENNQGSATAYLSSKRKTTQTKTTGTSYNTRSSTSGTNYGTATTNDTLTSSSWQ